MRMLHLQDDDVEPADRVAGPVEQPADRIVIPPVPEDKVAVNDIELTLQSGCQYGLST